MEGWMLWAVQNTATISVLKFTSNTPAHTSSDVRLGISTPYPVQPNTLDRKHVLVCSREGEVELVLLNVGMFGR